MTLRELTAIVVLYRAASPAARQRALELMPELHEWLTDDYVPQGVRHLKKVHDADDLGERC